jgi:hypothetical protein
MDPNPYEAPKADLSGSGARAVTPLPSGEALPAELELRAMELLGRKRSRLTGVSFAVSWAIFTVLLALFLGLIWAFILGGALAGAFSRYHVRNKTPILVAEVSAELGIPPGAFQPERYLL